MQASQISWPVNPFRNRVQPKPQSMVTADQYAEQIGRSKAVARRRLEEMVSDGRASRRVGHTTYGKRVIVINYVLKGGTEI